ncbi:hypothetical protein ACFLW6_00190 [Chloroflexota bacterium]
MKRVRVTEELAYGGALDRLTGNDKPAAPPAEETIAPPEKAPMIKLSVFLPRQEDAYLENLASIAKFSGGKKLSKTRLIEAMVRAFRNSDLDVREVRTDEELLKRVNAQLRK